MVKKKVLRVRAVHLTTRLTETSIPGLRGAFLGPQKSEWTGTGSRGNDTTKSRFKSTVRRTVQPWSAVFFCFLAILFHVPENRVTGSPQRVTGDQLFSTISYMAKKLSN